MFAEEGRPVDVEYESESEQPLSEKAKNSYPHSSYFL
jgi:hypothetical protein